MARNRFLWDRDPYGSLSTSIASASHARPTPKLRPPARRSQPRKRGLGQVTPKISLRDCRVPRAALLPITIDNQQEYLDHPVIANQDFLDAVPFQRFGHAPEQRLWQTRTLALGLSIAAIIASTIGFRMYWSLRKSSGMIENFHWHRSPSENATTFSNHPERMQPRQILLRGARARPRESP